MAATIVVLLSWLVYGIVAHPPATSYLPPGAGRPAVQAAPVVAPAGGGPAVSGPWVPGTGISGPSSTYLPPIRAGRRPAGSTETGVPPVGAKRPSLKRPVVSAPVIAAQSVQRPTVTGVSIGKFLAIQAPAVSRPAASTPVVRRPSYSGVAARPGPLVSTGYHKAASGYGPSNVGSHAPY